MTNQIRGLLFDKDGTLFDFHTTWGAWAETFFRDISRGDAELASAVASKMGYDFANKAFDKESIIIAGTPNEVMLALKEHVLGWSEEELFNHINKVASEVPQVEPVPLIPLLEGFRAKGMRLGVATNDSEVPAMAHLGSAGIIDLLDFIAGFDSGYGSKPETGMQMGFCDVTGLAPSEVAMVGDSLHDLISGRDAGMTTIAVLTGTAEVHELAPYADVVLPHIGEIPGYLGH